MTEYDLVLAGGEVLDDAAGLSGVAHVAVAGGRIAAIGSDVDLTAAERVLDVRGKLVTPGLIDLHAHVLSGVNRNGADPDLVGVLSGVTTVVDAGSAGSATFQAFPSWVAPAARTDVVPFLHVGQTGLATSPDISSATDVKIEDTRRVLLDNPDLIAGLKVRMVSPAVEIFGNRLLRDAKRLAREAGVPVMVHVGDILGRADPRLGREVLDQLDEGDILTHIYTPHPGGVLDRDGKVFPELWAALERGVHIDLGHGRRNCSFDVARRVLDQGVPLHSISTDITRPGRTDLVGSLPEIMSRFFELGFSLPEIITKCTTGPAGALGRADTAGRLAVGRVADISVLDLRRGDWAVTDSVGEALPISHAFVPVATVRKGALISPDFGPHPWGWEPGPRSPKEAGR